MAEYLAPAVYVEETSFRSKSIEGVGTSTTAFVGLTARGPVSAGVGAVIPPLLTSFSDYETYYGGVDDLMIGGRTSEVASKHGLSPARVAQLRREFHDDWEQFCACAAEDGILLIAV